MMNGNAVSVCERSENDFQACLTHTLVVTAVILSSSGAHAHLPRKEFQRDVLSLHANTSSREGHAFLKSAGQLVSHLFFRNSLKRLPNSNIAFT